MSYYEILNVSKSSSQDEIKKAWKKQSMLFHPDRLPEEQKNSGEAKIKDINKAYEVLQDPEKRKIYDQFGEAGLSNNPNSGGMPDIFSHLFNNMGNFNMRQDSQNTQAPPIPVQVELTLEKIYLGCKISKKITRNIMCKSCNYTGFNDKVNHTCKKCKGERFTNIVRQIGPGMIQQMRGPCNTCSATGKDTGFKSCSTCKGTTLVEEEYTLVHEIPRGVHHGEQILVENIGHEFKVNKRSPVVLVVTQKEHPIFTRKDDDLHLTLDITLLESLCGFYKVITQLDGRKLYFTTEDNIVKHKDVFVISGEGIGLKGNMYISYNVVYPDDISKDVKTKLVEILGDNSYKKSLEITDNYILVFSKPYNTGESSSSSSMKDEEGDNEEHGQAQNVECRQQ